MSEKPSIEKLVAIFANSVIAQNNADDVEIGNKHAKEGNRAFETLVEVYGDAGREALTVLLKHDDPSVRCRTAAFLLRYSNDEAMAVLKELEAGSGLTSLKAKYCIMNWENGTWELDLAE